MRAASRSEPVLRRLPVTAEVVQRQPDRRQEGVAAARARLRRTRLPLVEVRPNQRLGAREVGDSRVWVGRMEEVEQLDVRLPGGRERLSRWGAVDAERPDAGDWDVEARPARSRQLSRAETARGRRSRRRHGQCDYSAK